MVFYSGFEEGRLPENIKAMASAASVKSQPLHNFSLPDLKWTVNYSNNHRFRKFAASIPRDSEELVRFSSPLGICLDSDDRRRRKNGVFESSLKSCLIENPVKISEKKPKVCVENVEEGSMERRSKNLLRFHNKSKTVTDPATEAGDQARVAMDGQESRPKTWNLRPRKLVLKKSNAIQTIVGAPKIAGTEQETKIQVRNRPESTRPRSVLDAKGAEKTEKKQQLTIPLTKEEIEKDIFSLTGSKPARRPKKRARIVQKQVDNCFPGLWLASITPDLYRIPDTHMNVVR